MATTPTINTGSLPQFTDLVKRSFLDGLKSLNQNMRNSGLVNEESMPLNTGLFKRYAERLTRPEYGSYRAEGDAAAQALIQYGYEKDLGVYTIALAVSITELMRLGGKNQEVIDSVTSISEVIPNSIDLDLSHRITFCTATSYTDRDGRTIDVTMGDGLAAASASHTLTGSATTYSTVITGNPQFSKGALETAEKSFVENTYNNLGEKMALKPNTILTTDDPNTINQVRELMNATADVSTSNAGTFNVYKNKYRHVVAPRIATTAAGATDSTKAKYWALAASDASDLQLTILQDATLSTPMDGNNGEDIATGNWNYVVRGVYGICMVTARAWRFSTGLGA